MSEKDRSKLILSAFPEIPRGMRDLVFESDQFFFAQIGSAMISRYHWFYEKNPNISNYENETDFQTWMQWPEFKRSQLGDLFEEYHNFRVSRRNVKQGLYESDEEIERIWGNDRYTVMVVMYEYLFSEIDRVITKGTEIRIIDTGNKNSMILGGIVLVVLILICAGIF